MADNPLVTIGAVHVNVTLWLVPMGMAWAMIGTMIGIDINIVNRVSSKVIFLALIILTIIISSLSALRLLSSILFAQLLVQPCSHANKHSGSLHRHSFVTLKPSA